MKQLLYSPGEPAGIGVDSILYISKLKFWEEMNVNLICIADGDLLQSRTKALNLNIKFKELKSLNRAKQNKKGIVQFVQVAECKDFTPGQLNSENAQYIIKNLNFGIDQALKNKKIGLVTGPIQKSNIIEGGFKDFQGHTEWIKKQTKSKEVVMLLAAKNVKVALATTHIPLADVSKNIQKSKLIEIIKILNFGLKNNFKIKHPRIKVLGLNPHAGDGGYIGHEEEEILKPFVNSSKENVHGPISADTAFIEKNIKKYDVFLAMYHDQGLPVIKSMGFGNTLNVTLGLPFIRISVDHGTAYEIAGKNKADFSSMDEALKTSVSLL